MGASRQKKEAINADKEKVLELVRTRPQGILSSEIVELTGLNIRYIQRLLISLRNDEYVFSEEVSTNKSCRTHRWTSYPPSTIVDNSEKPYPDLDETHKAWCKRVTERKSLYNPWGKI